AVLREIVLPAVEILEHQRRRLAAAPGLEFVEIGGLCGQGEKQQKYQRDSHGGKKITGRFRRPACLNTVRSGSLLRSEGRSAIPGIAPFCGEREESQDKRCLHLEGRSLRQRAASARWTATGCEVYRIAKTPPPDRQRVATAAGARVWRCRSSASSTSGMSPAPPASTWRRISARMRGSQKRFRCEAISACACSRSSSAWKKAPMSFAILTSLSTLTPPPPRGRPRLPGARCRCRPSRPGPPPRPARWWPGGGPRRHAVPGRSTAPCVRPGSRPCSASRPGDFPLLEQPVLLRAEALEAALPLGGLGHARHLHGGDFVLGAVGRPVRIVGGDHVRTRAWKVEGSVDHARLHPFGDARAQHGLAGAAADADPVALVDAARLRVVGMDLEPVLVVPHDVGGSPRL